MLHITDRTAPFPDAQAPRSRPLAATNGAHLRGWIKAVNLDQLLAVVLAFPFQNPPELSPGRSLNGVSHPGRLTHHRIGVQRLHTYNIVSANQLRSQLMKRIRSAAVNPLLEPFNLVICLFPIFASRLFSPERIVKLIETVLMGGEAKVKLLAAGQRSIGFQAQVNPNRFAGFRSWKLGAVRLVIEGDVVFSILVGPLAGNGRRYNPSFNGLRLPELYEG